MGGTTEISGTGAENGSNLTRLLTGTAAFNPISIKGCQSFSPSKLFCGSISLLADLFTLLRHVLWHCLQTGIVSGTMGLERTVT